MKFPIIIAHRGANSFAPENSLAAFQKAIELGCEGIELDLRYTGDRQVVVFHDRNTFRMTGEHGSVRRLSLDQLRRRRLFHPDFPFEKIPTLPEVLEIAGKNTLINLDIKKESVSHNGFEENILRILLDMGFIENVVISSFNPFILKKIKALHPGVQVGFIFRNRSSMMMLNGSPVESLHARYRILSQRYLQALRHRADKVYAWTVDKEKAMLTMIQKGVDGIITNRPELLISLKHSILFPFETVETMTLSLVHS